MLSFQLASGTLTLGVIDALYIAITVLSAVSTFFAFRLLMILKKHYGLIEEFGAAIGFLRSDKFLQFVQVLSISVLLWLASILSTVGVSVKEAGHVLTKSFELLSIIAFIVGCYTAINVVEKYEFKKPKKKKA